MRNLHILFDQRATDYVIVGLRAIPKYETKRKNEIYY